MSALDETKNGEVMDKDAHFALSDVSDAKGIYAPLSPENSPVVLTWEKMVASTMPKRGRPAKDLLKGVSGTITGGLWGIMGASGSGKTTFLSVLSHRIDTNRMTVTGSVRMNGQTYTKNKLKSMSGYVMQDDLIHAMLTVQETLEYQAALRMNKGTTSDDRKKRIEEVLETVGIAYCRDVIVGDSRNKGISGGERKRLCVAIELLTRPKLLFLDEPTSGLDSSTALDLMTTLKGLADSGECTVVCTIHQPQTKIYNLIDNLLLMKKGEIVYQGSRDKCEEFFASQGYPLPDRCNPADHVIDVLTMGAKGEKQEANIAKLVVPIDLDCGIGKHDFQLRAIQPWAWQFLVLIHRNFMEKIRRWDIIVMNLFITALVATFIGCGAWYQIGNYQDSIAKRNPILFFCVIHQGVVSSLQGTYAFPLERALMLRERASGAYYVSSYFLAKTAVDQFFQVFNPILYAIFVYLLCGLNLSTYKHFFSFMGFNILLSFCATSLSNLASCICVSIEMSTVVLACCMEITRLYSAFFVSPVLLNSTPAFRRWLFADAISYMKYGFIGLCLNEYTDLTLQCSPKQLNAKGVCPTTSGVPIMKQFGYDMYTMTYCAGIMCVYIFIARLFSYLALRFIKV